MKIRKWRPGIPTSLVCKCPYCGKIPEVDYVIEDKLWFRVVPKKYRTGVVCLGCFSKLAIKRKIDWTYYIKRMFLATDSMVQSGLILELKIKRIFSPPPKRFRYK